MEILEILEKDHDKVRELMERILESSSGAVKSRQQNYSKLKKELLEHMHAEEKTFYPNLAEKTEDKGIIYEALEEHRVVRLALPDCDSTDISDPQWKSKFKVISEMINHHIDEEEDQIFEAAQDVLDEEADSQLVQEFKQAKQDAEIKV